MLYKNTTDSDKVYKLLGEEHIVQPGQEVDIPKGAGRVAGLTLIQT